MFRDAEGEEELRLAIEEEGAEPARLAGPDQIVEVDVRRQVLLSRIREQVPRHPLPRIGGRGAEAADARVEELPLREPVIEREDEAALDEPRQLVVERTPFEGDVGE